jgi:Cu/Ag efflux protein CusF
MKRIVILALALTFAWIGLAAAADMDGTIKSVDTGSKEVSLDNGGAVIVVIVDDGTTITMDGKDAKLDDLKEGTKVKASYDEKDGKNVASKIDATQ